MQRLVDAWYLTLDWIAAHPEEATAIMAEKAAVTPEEYAEYAEGTTIFDAERRSPRSRTARATRHRCRRWPGGSTRSWWSPG